MRPEIDTTSRAFRSAQARARVDNFSRYLQADPNPPPGAFFRVSGEIGEGKAVNAAGIERKLKLYSLEKQIEVVIDSPGGNLQEARKIYALLRGSGKHVSTRAIGTCASAATIILLAGDWREANSTALFGLHEIELEPERARPAVGKGRWTADFHSRISNMMREENAKLASFYAGRSGKPIHMFRQAMTAEKRLSADEAVRMGLVHAVLDPQAPRWAASK
jgi:ATP-dependent protease ClpP protease subunit